MAHGPASDYARVTVPVLAVTGGNDMRVPSAMTLRPETAPAGVPLAKGSRLSVVTVAGAGRPNGWAYRSRG